MNKIDWRKEWVRLSVTRAGIAEFIRMLRAFYAPKFDVPAHTVDGKFIVTVLKVIDKAAPVSWNAEDKMIVIR